MVDALRTIMEGILNLVTHGGVLVIVLAAMLAIILLTAWIDGSENAERAHKQRRARRRRDPARDRAADRESR